MSSDLYSDNAINFKGAKREITELYQFLQNQKNSDEIYNNHARIQCYEHTAESTFVLAASSANETTLLGSLEPKSPTVRRKWHKGTTKEIQVGTIVTIRDENLPPMQWSLDRIIALTLALIKLYAW